MRDACWSLRLNPTMRWLCLSVALLSHQLTAVHGKSVFANFLVGNAPGYATSDWVDDFTKAQDAHIDGFAMSIAHGDGTNKGSLQAAFHVALSVGFTLFLTFDNVASGPWPAEDVIDYVNEFKTSPAYFHYNGDPLVSTFGDQIVTATDWPDVIEQTSIFFVPAWPGLGAQQAMDTGLPDGLLSWFAWPEGANDKFTTIDASYVAALKGQPYMMPVSPWFFTNLPGYDKNWLWRGDDLWYDRWVQIWTMAPEFVQIISWNNYGESHHIGPIRNISLGAFDLGGAPYNYAADMPHDGWRLLLPYVIDVYKNGGRATISQEGLVTWFRPQPATACKTGGTVGNQPDSSQCLYRPESLVQDKIFYTALLGSNADIAVSVGGRDQQAKWTSTPDGGVGLWHGSVAYRGTGNVSVTVTRAGAQVAQVVGGHISTDCTDGIENWNAWVGASTSPKAVSVPAPSYLETMSCKSGRGLLDYDALCSFSCRFNYCPPYQCTCREVGVPVAPPPSLGLRGCPAAGYNITSLGLCDFGCSHGFCPPMCVRYNATERSCSPPPLGDVTYLGPPQYCNHASKRSVTLPGARGGRLPSRSTQPRSSGRRSRTGEDRSSAAKRSVVYRKNP